MDNKEKQQLMNASVKPIIDLLQNRLGNSIDAMKAFESNGIDQVPVEVQQMRESELQKIRAVMQEQKDLITVLKIMYPNA